MILTFPNSLVLASARWVSSCSLSFIQMQFKVKATLAKCNTTTGAVSTWQFGRLDNGWYGAKLLNGSKRLYFNSVAKMNTCIGKFITDYDYTVVTKPAAEQLSLAL